MKIDANAQQIVDGLREAGASVDILQGGNGRPDLLVGHGHANFLLEVKDERGKFTPMQKKWHAAWRGKAHVVRSLEDALLVIGARVSKDMGPL